MGRSGYLGGSVFLVSPFVICIGTHGVVISWVCLELTIDHLLAVLSIDLVELSAGQNLPRCII